MKKIIILLLLISLLSGGVLFFTQYFPFEKKVSESSQTWTVNTEDVSQSWALQENQELSKEEIVRQKIETIKKRLALKWLIIEWDSYYRGGQIPLALKKYLEFYKQNPEDPVINKKIWDTYFGMHKYGSAINYYSKIDEKSSEDLHKIALSHIYNTPLDSPEKLEQLKGKILSLEFPKQEEFYYLNSLACSENFHECKKVFGEYFWPTEEENTWEEIQQDENRQENAQEEVQPLLPELNAIKQAIQNYRNFQVDDVYLKDAYIIGAFYKNKLFSISIDLWEKLLQEKIDYKPILKIVGQSYFELWEYEKARDVFTRYYEIDPNDAWVSFTLWIINTKLRDYVLANINYHKALDLEYSNASDIYRQLIHNYYLLENDQSMLQSFVNLIETWDYESEDLGLAIYYHIIHEDYETALKWSKLWQEKFTETWNFYAYEGWILREQWDIETALEILTKWNDIDENNPFILINLAYTHIHNDNTSAGIVILKTILFNSPNSEFARMAQQELENLQTWDNS